VNGLLDPVLRAPLWGACCLSVSLSLLGVFLFLQKKTLVGEALSHASYPGVLLAIFFSSILPLSTTVYIFAAFTAYLGFWLLQQLKDKLKIKEDAALCLILSTFFGMGTLLASIVQSDSPKLFRQIPLFLYGQAVTIQDSQLIVYAAFTLLTLLFVGLFYRPLLVMSFDKVSVIYKGNFLKWLEAGFFIWVTWAIVLAMRSLGVILLSALLVAPATAARQYTHNVKKMLWIAAAVGLASGFIGTLISLKGLPTGPCIVLVACLITAFSLLFAPKRGLVARLMRILAFKMKIQEENMLKSLWLNRSVKASWLSWTRLLAKGLISSERKLTQKGLMEGARITRLHRLWEVYLFRSLGMNIDKVHECAEQMEHILTPEIEKQLTSLLDNPDEDPHAKPIPKPMDVRA
jgi:manganese/zinc/iron transport system permease protein